MSTHRAKLSLPASLKSHWRIAALCLFLSFLLAVSHSPDVEARRSPRLQAGDVPQGLTALKSSAG
ncbi:MAG: hypothetical protein AB1631_10375, partial [Acidobacteriota bacterium]